MKKLCIGSENQRNLQNLEFIRARFHKALWQVLSNANKYFMTHVSRYHIYVMIDITVTFWGQEAFSCNFLIHLV